jgi:hypothetical protein
MTAIGTTASKIRQNAATVADFVTLTQLNIVRSGISCFIKWCVTFIIYFFASMFKSWGAGVGRTDCMASSVMGMMYREMEFEYLASRVGFFQVRGRLSFLLLSLSTTNMPRMISCANFEVIR